MQNRLIPLILGKRSEYQFSFDLVGQCEKERRSTWGDEKVFCRTKREAHTACKRTITLLVRTILSDKLRRQNLLTTSMGQGHTTNTTSDLEATGQDARHDLRLDSLTFGLPQ